MNEILLLIGIFLLLIITGYTAWQYEHLSDRFDALYQWTGERFQAIGALKDCEDCEDDDAESEISTASVAESRGSRDDAPYIVGNEGWRRRRSDMVGMPTMSDADTAAHEPSASDVEARKDGVAI